MGITAALLIASLLAAAAVGKTGVVGASNAKSYGEAHMDDMRKAAEEAGLSDADADYLINRYSKYGDDTGNFWNTFINPSRWFDDGVDEQGFQRDLAEYLSLKDQLGERPADVDYAALANSANNAVDAENARLFDLYDQILGRSNTLFQNELDANNAAFRDYVGQVQSNNAMATNAIAGSTRYEMDRARRNAIRRGASAAQQLTASVNAQLGLQNRAAQQQLETSNQLAAALLQQRQAASQLRGDYVDNLNADASRRASLISGTAERKAGLRNSYYNEAESRHEAELDQWKNRMSGYLGDSPFQDVYNRSQNRDSSRKSTYGL